MSTFAETYTRNEFGFDKERVSQAAPLLGYTRAGSKC
jgi:hypothetical protein